MLKLQKLFVFKVWTSLLPNFNIAAARLKKSDFCCHNQANCGIDQKKKKKPGKLWPQHVIFLKLVAKVGPEGPNIRLLGQKLGFQVGPFEIWGLD